MRNTKLILPLLLFCLVGPIALLGSPARAFAQAKSYHMDRYDSDISINQDGSMDIVETLIYAFTSGTFSRGLRTWDLDRLGAMTVNDVTELGNHPITYRKSSFD